MADPIRRRPSPASLSWAAEAVAAGGRVVAYRRLTGGITAAMHRLTIEDTSGRRHQAVLRRWVGPGAASAAKQIENEAAVLRSLAGSGLPVPMLIAATTGDATGGEPALLMTRVPGGVNLTPTDPAAWVGQMAAMLPRIHALPIEGRAMSPWSRLVEQGVPPWTTQPALWRDAIDVLSAPAPAGSCFIHSDYQHFNLLWRRDRLSGIVDWTWAGSGAPDRDVGHCRLNLAVLFSVEMAERFRAAYEAEAGRRVETWWDVHELALYSDDWLRFIPVQVSGRIGVDVAGMTDRVEALLALVLRR